jgi:hypothetical protein
MDRRVCDEVIRDTDNAYAILDSGHCGTADGDFTTSVAEYTHFIYS